MLIGLVLMATGFVARGAVRGLLAATGAMPRERPATGAQGMIGLTGEVTHAAPPHGPRATAKVAVHGELWSARLSPGHTAPLEEGQTVEVVGLEGLVLEVKPVEEA
jgi:membrane-bound ClpP family serine protease